MSISTKCMASCDFLTPLSKINPILLCDSSTSWLYPEGPAQISVPWFQLCPLSMLLFTVMFDRDVVELGFEMYSASPERMIDP